MAQLKRREEIKEAEHTREDEEHQAVVRLMVLRNTLAEVKDQLAEAETAVLGIVGRLPREGTVEREVGNHKIKVQQRITRSVDSSRIDKVMSELPDYVSARLFKPSYKVAMKELRFLEENDIKTYRLAKRAIKARQAKPTINIEEV